MMPNIRKIVTEIRRNLNRAFLFLTSDALPVAKQLAYYTFKRTNVTSHIVFIGRCLRKRLIPKGFRIKFHSIRELTIATNASLRLPTRAPAV